MGNFGSKRSKSQGDRSESSEGKMGDACARVEILFPSSPTLLKWARIGNG